MLYTRKGDKGTTKLFDCDQRISKSSDIAEALGTVDELNSCLGLLRAKTFKSEVSLIDFSQSIAELINEIQHQLFIIQAELAGAPEKTIAEKQIEKLELITDTAEGQLPKISSFFVPGGTELGAEFDLARTIARRAERRVITVVDKKERKVGEYSLAYLNRLSSVLYALARLMTHKSGITEEAPKYE